MLNNVQNQSALTGRLPFLIHIKRTVENSLHTYGSFTLKEPGTEQTALSGYSVEPGGFSGPAHLSGKKLPAGTYRLSWQFIPGDGNRLVLYNMQVAEHQRVLLGNAGIISEEENSYLVLSATARYHSDGGASLHSARDMRNKLEAYVRRAGVENVQVQIDDF
jgi:hypothetical protein